MNRKKINRYAKQQEDRMEKRLIDIGFELVEDTGRRTTKTGDRIMRHKDTGLLLVVDHKSTQSEITIKNSKNQLRKIKDEASKYSRQALPAITFGFKGDNRLYIILDVDDLEGIMY